MSQEYLSVKEVAAAAGVSTQYIYKILGSSLKPYKKKINKKTMIEAAAIDYIIHGFPTNTTEEYNQVQPIHQEDLQPMQPTLQPTNATENNQGEIEALKLLVEELKAEKEELKADKEYLKNELVKWQSILADERNKIKLLEAAAEEQQESIIEEQPKGTEEAAAFGAEQERETEAEQEQSYPQTFTEKIKWLFSKK